MSIRRNLRTRRDLQFRFSVCDVMKKASLPFDDVDGVSVKSVNVVIQLVTRSGMSPLGHSLNVRVIFCCWLAVSC